MYIIGCGVSGFADGFKIVRVHRPPAAHDCAEGFRRNSGLASNNAVLDPMRIDIRADTLMDLHTVPPFENPALLELCL